MRRRALLTSLGAAIGLAGCIGKSNKGEQTRKREVPKQATSETHRQSDNNIPGKQTTQIDTAETPTTSAPTDTVTSTPTKRTIKIRIGYEAHFRNHFRGKSPADGEQWLVVRYTAYNFGGKAVALGPDDFSWVGHNERVDRPTGPVPYSYLGRRSYTESDSIYPDQSTTRSMTFAVPKSATSQNLDLDFRPPATIEMYPATLPDRRNCQLEEFDCRGL